MWNIFRSLVFTSVFLLIQLILPLCFKHAWLCLDFVFALLLAIWWFRFGFGSCEWIRQKTIASSWFHGKLNFSEKSKFLSLLWPFLIDGKWYSSHEFSEDLGYEILKKKLKRKCEKIILKLELAKWRQNMVCSFFQMLAQFQSSCSAIGT